jgi:hypothetical protein
MAKVVRSHICDYVELYNFVFLIDSLVKILPAGLTYLGPCWGSQCDNDVAIEQYSPQEGKAATRI